MSGGSAERVREALRERPFLRHALAADVVNYAAAARFLGEESEAAAAALRRHAEELDFRTPERRVRVTIERGVGPAEDESGGVLRVGGTAFRPEEGELVCVLASGDADPRALSHALDVLDASGVTVEAAGVGGETMAVVVGRRDGPDALRAVERAVAGVPEVSRP
jgi:hypothetical protein